MPGSLLIPQGGGGGTVSVDVTYTLTVTDSGGTVYGNLLDAELVSVTQELNGFGGCTFRVPTYTSDPNLIKAGGQREIKVYRDRGDGSGPALIFWGPMVRVRAVLDATEVQCMGRLWYLSRVFFSPVLKEYLVNPDFESDFTGWGASVGTTASIDTAIVRKGTKAAKLVSTDQHLDNFVPQSFSYTAGTIPVAFFAAAEFNIVTTAGTAYIGPAYLERGLYVEVIAPGNVLEKAVWTPISNSAPRNEWVRIYAPPVTVPANSTRTIKVRLYSPGGEIHWDMCTCKVEESTGANTANGINDLNGILNNVCFYARDITVNKPDTRVFGPVGTLGVSQQRQFQFYDNGNIWDTAFKPLIDGGMCDIDIDDTRTVTTFLIKGAFRAAAPLTLGTNVGDFTYDYDGQNTAAAVTVLGQQKQKTLSTPPGTIYPAAQYRGYAADTAANSGLTFQAIVSTATETPPDGIDKKATADVARLKNVVTIPTVVAKEITGTPLIGVLNTGDTCTVTVVYGLVNETVTRRIIAWTLKPGAEETITYTLGLPAVQGTNSFAPTHNAQIQTTGAGLYNAARVIDTHVPVDPKGEIIYTRDGALAVSTSPAVSPRDSVTVVGLSVTLTAASSSGNVVVNLLKNGVVVGTVTLVAGVTYGHTSLSPIAYVARTDTYAFSISSAGTGASQLGGTMELA